MRRDRRKDACLSGSTEGQNSTRMLADLGATVTEVTPLYYEVPRQPTRWWQRARELKEENYVETGLIFETTKGSVAIADAGDEYAVGAWPNKERWAAIDVLNEVDPRRVP